MKTLKLLILMCLSCTVFLTTTGHTNKHIPEAAPSLEYEEGIVSYYGEKWNGRTTANMEIYNCNLLTCASPTLPFNTILKITNLKTCLSVVVRVNDRGPFEMDSIGRVLRPLKPHPKRVLDLSKAAFDSIGELDDGLLNVRYIKIG
jgi:rare lipoprotein A